MGPAGTSPEISAIMVVRTETGRDIDVPITQLVGEPGKDVRFYVVLPDEMNPEERTVRRGRTTSSRRKKREPPRQPRRLPPLLRKEGSFLLTMLLVQAEDIAGWVAESGSYFGGVGS